ncbi:Hypothetical protein A7982_01773 [Minicystis rosea]|nr:Hypothetical protein A7982_01773 [Minicystis rosea]
MSLLFGETDSTTKQTNVDGDDIPIQLTYAGLPFVVGEGTAYPGPASMRDPTLLGRGDYRTWIIPTGAVGLPVSRRSRGYGLYAETTVGLGVRQQLKLFGSEAPSLSHLFITLSERWTHVFAKQATVDSPLVSASLLANRLGHTIELLLPLYRGLELRAELGLDQPFKGRSPTTCIQTPTGCVHVLPASMSLIPGTRFDVDLAYAFLPELAVTFGYANATTGLSATGKRYSVFYSPDAMIFANVAFSFDRLYQRFAVPPNAAR